MACTCGADRTRRAALIRLAALGSAALFGRGRPAAAMGMAEGRLHQAEGEVRINGRIAEAGAAVAAGDLIGAGPGGRAVFTLGDDAFLLRSDGAVSVSDRDGVRELSLERGRVLSVFGPKRITLKTSHASVGIRGTGAYLEAEPAETRLCLCYGAALLTPLGRPAKAEELRTRHHDSPRRIRGGAMEPYKQADHTDEELVMLEALLGRVPPFVTR